MAQGNAGAVSAALAFLQAGNLPAAERLLGPLLAENPPDSDACEAWAKLLVARKNFAELERFAKDWIGRDGENVMAHFNLVGSFAGRKDRENAEAALRTMCASVPMGEFYAGPLRALIENNCGTTASSYHEMIAMHRSAGNDAQALRFESQAAYRNRRFAEAIRLGEESWRAGYTETTFASYLAMLSFRTFRFGKSRHYARLALRAEPGHAVATELIWLTRLVWFPPFLLAHAALFALAQRHHERDTCAVVACRSLVILTGLTILAAAVAPAPGLEAAALAACALAYGYCRYFPAIGALARWAGRFRRTEVRLQNY